MGRRSHAQQEDPSRETHTWGRIWPDAFSRRLLLSNPLLPCLAGRIDPGFGTVHRYGTADGLGELSSDRLAAHGSRHYRDCSISELVDSGVEAVPISRRR